MSDSAPIPSAPASFPESLATLMSYKQWADAELLAAIRSIGPLARLLLGGVLLAIVRHIHAVDRVFRAHLLGIPHGLSSPNPSHPASLDALEESVRSTDAWFVAWARELRASEASEMLLITFTDGSRQRLTRLEMGQHVLLHGAFHRGNAGILLRLCRVPALPDRLTSYLRLTRAG
ncbi:MAG: DinB family protein [Polyangiaceae bacterium]